MNKNKEMELDFVGDKLTKNIENMIIGDTKL